jgi:hypothetical protein
MSHVGELINVVRLGAVADHQLNVSLEDTVLKLQT